MRRMVRSPSLLLIASLSSRLTLLLNSATINTKGAKTCGQCHVRFYSIVTSAAPSQIFCARCGFLNDGENQRCVQCDTTIRSTLEKISTDLRDSTNFIARDMGMNINVQCPGCSMICFVPPATACLRCGTCHTYFASPSLGEVTNFHMSKLASSISSSFMGFFDSKRSGAEADEPTVAPVGRLLAIGERLSRSPHAESERRRLSSEDESSASAAAAAAEVSAPLTAQAAGFRTSLRQYQRPRQVDENEQKDDRPRSKTTDRQNQPSKQQIPSAVPLALPPAPQDLVQVEGDIVEL